jgi:hypothetical protein
MLTVVDGIGCGAQAEYADRIEGHSKEADGLGNANKDWIVGPYAAVNQAHSADDMRWEISRRRGRGECHVHHALATVAAQSWVMWRLEDMNLVTP